MGGAQVCLEDAVSGRGRNSAAKRAAFVERSVEGVPCNAAADFVFARAHGRSNWPAGRRSSELLPGLAPQPARDITQTVTKLAKPQSTPAGQVLADSVEAHAQDAK